MTSFSESTTPVVYVVIDVAIIIVFSLSLCFCFVFATSAAAAAAGVVAIATTLSEVIVLSVAVADALALLCCHAAAGGFDGVGLLPMLEPPPLRGPCSQWPSVRRAREPPKGKPRTPSSLLAMRPSTPGPVAGGRTRAYRSNVWRQ